MSVFGGIHMLRVLSGTTCMGDTEKMDDAGKEKERNDIMKSLLVVVDMQKDFIDGSLGTREAQKIVKNVAEKSRAPRLPERRWCLPTTRIRKIIWKPRRENVFRWSIASRELPDGN